MRLNRLDLNLLIALDALLTECSITRAAEKIHLSQPATSGALARLRDYFGDELLVRVGSRMKPTALGESLAAPVHNILLQIQAMVEGGVEFDAAESDRCFRILMSDFSSGQLMPPLVRHLSEIAPNVQIEVLPTVNHPTDELEQGNTDFLIMPEHLLSPDHPSRQLFVEHFVVIGCKKNPAMRKKLTPEKYMGMHHVTARFGANRALSFDQILLNERFGVELRYDIISASFNGIPELLLETDRIATVYSSMAKRWCEYLPLKMQPLPFELPHVQWAVQWHQYRDLDPGLKWLRNQLVQVAAEIGRNGE